MNNRSLLVNKFIGKVELRGAAIERIFPSPVNLKNSLLKIISNNSNVIMSEPEFIPGSLFEDFIEEAKPNLKPDAAQLTSADFGITDAFAGVAGTGSVCIQINSGLASYTSLLPKTHIAVLESKNIVERPRNIYDKYIIPESAQKKGWVFISGPSATADMGELVLGAHGPSKLHIILLDESDEL